MKALALTSELGTSFRPQERLLTIDRYVQEILQVTPRSIDTVTIEPNGKWSFNDSRNGNSNGVKRSPEDDDSDDLVEIVEAGRPSIKTEAPNTPYSLNMTPPVPSPGSAVSASVASRGTKRKSEVIDLTLSDDDEPAAKRPALTPVERVRNGYPSISRNPSFTTVTNGNLSFQQQLIGRPSYGGSSNSYSSTTHPSPMAGSPLAPITISSPPSRPSPVQLDYSNSLNFQQQHRQPSHHPPPPQRQGSSSGTNPAQRATLLGLAGRRPYDS
jgi:E3 SUMO-protein ligase PIAS1